MNKMERETINVNDISRPHGDHFDGVTPGTYRYKIWTGGPEQLTKIRALMDKTEQQLPTCPFCGASAVLRGRFLIISPGVSVECSRCRCGTATFFEGQDISGKCHILEDQIIEAVARWSRRA